MERGAAAPPEPDRFVYRIRCEPQRARRSPSRSSAARGASSSTGCRRRAEPAPRAAPGPKTRAATPHAIRPWPRGRSIMTTRSCSANSKPGRNRCEREHRVRHDEERTADRDQRRPTGPRTPPSRRARHRNGDRDEQRAEARTEQREERDVPDDVDERPRGKPPTAVRRGQPDEQHDERDVRREERAGAPARTSRGTRAARRPPTSRRGPTTSTPQPTRGRGARTDVGRRR